MNRLQAKSKGFTLIELITVVVILGILGAVALGKYEDLSEDAHTEAARRGIIEFQRVTRTTFFNYQTERDADPTAVEIRPGVSIPVNAQGWPGSLHQCRLPEPVAGPDDELGTDESTGYGPNPHHCARLGILGKRWHLPVFLRTGHVPVKVYSLRSRYRAVHTCRCLALPAYCFGGNQKFLFLA